MRYCVLVQISKSNISFWYQQEGAPFEPLSQKEGNTLPLYFYANDNEFVLGSIARERFLNGDQVNAFGNYFDIITNPSSFFNLYGNQKHVKFLLYYAVEKYLTHFLHTVLIKQESIEGYRNNFPLRFTFSNDIAQKEKLLVEGIFKESGYDNIESISFSKFLFTYLSNEKLFDPKQKLILLTGIDGNLFVELFSHSFTNAIYHVIVEDQGADPRIKIMAKMIYDDAMATSRLNLNEKNELFHLLPFAKQFLAQDSAIPKGDITLSDGTNCWVKIKRKDLDEQLVYYSGEEKIFKAVEKLLFENGIQSSTAKFLLNGDAVNTQYFIDRFKKKYSNVIGVPITAEKETLKLIFKYICDSDYKVNATSLIELGSSTINDSTLLNLPTTLSRKESIHPPPPPPPPVNKRPPTPPPPPPPPQVAKNKTPPPPPPPPPSRNDIKKQVPPPPPPFKKKSD